MSEDLTEKLPKNNNDSKILMAIKDLEKKVDGIEKKVDERLHDTRPIWHKVVADIGELQSGQKRLEEGQKHLEEGQKHLEEGQQALRVGMTQLYSAVREVSRDQIVINESLRKIQLDFRTIDDRLYRLEVNRNQQNSST